MGDLIRTVSFLRTLTAAVCLTVLPLSASQLRADVDFYREISPFLKSNCISCHNKTTTEAGLNLESPETIRKGGDSGPGVVPGQAARSLIYQAAQQTGDYVMPPPDNKTGARKLTPPEMAKLAAWINEGAKNSIQTVEKVHWQPLAPNVRPIYCAAITRDGHYAACGRGNQLFVYDVATRQLAAQLVDEKLPGAAAAIAHHGLVQCVAFSPDGQRLASGSYREVKIWKRSPTAETRKPQAVLPDLVCCTQTPDGKLIVCGDKTGALQISDAGTGQTVRQIPPAGDDEIKQLLCSPNSKFLAGIGTGPNVRFWNLQNGQMTGQLTLPSAAGACAWTADNQAFAVAAADNVIRIWSVSAEGTPAEKPDQELKAPAAIAALTSVGTPSRMISAATDGQVHFWNVADGKLLHNLKIPGVLTVSCSVDGDLLAAGCADEVVRIWDLNTAKQTSELKGSLPDAQQIDTLNRQLELQQLELAYQKQESARLTAQNKVLDEVLKKANETIAKVKKELPAKDKAAAAAQAALATAQKAADDAAKKLGEAGEKADAAVTKQNTDAQKALEDARAKAMTADDDVAQLKNHQSDAEGELKNATALQQKNDGLIKAAEQLATAAQTAVQQATQKLADVKKAAQTPQFKPEAVAFSADSKTVAAVFTNGDIRVWALASGTPVAFLPGTTATKSAVLLSDASDRFRICRDDGSNVSIDTNPAWQLERILGGETAESPFADRINAVAFSPDGKTLATGGGEPSRSGDISLWNVETGQLLKTWNERHSDTVLSLDFSPNGELLASGAADKLARVTEIATGQQVHWFEGHTHHVMGVSFRADGRILASAGADGVVLIWDTVIGERERKVQGWIKEVTSLQFIGATNQIVTSSGDQLVRVIRDNGSEVRAIRSLPSFMQTAAGSDSGELLVGGGEDGVLHVWNGTNGQELTAFPAP